MSSILHTSDKIDTVIAASEARDMDAKLCQKKTVSCVFSCADDCRRHRTIVCRLFSVDGVSS